MDSQIIRGFLRQAAEALDTDMTGLARQAAVAPSTLTRVFKDDENSLPSYRTLAKVAQVSGVPIPSALAAPDEQNRLFTDLSIKMGKLEEFLKNLQEIEALAAQLKDAAAKAQGNELPEEERRLWLENLSKVPAIERDNLFKVVSGIAKASAAGKAKPEPGKASGTMNPGKRLAELTKT